MKTVKSPNLFNWATKELSQDAFICWLSEWANSNLVEKNLYMHLAGKKFVISLLKKHNIIVTEILSIEVFKQKSNIDIVLKIDTDVAKYVLIIEDKMHALDYNPLEQYFLSIQNDKYFEDYLPLGLFIKTGDQASYENIKSKFFAVYLRNDFIDFFNEIEHIEGHNDILSDFKKRLVYSHKSVNSFETLKIMDWHWDSWKGFYNSIQSDTKFKDWKYVSNPSGGFLCSNWGWKQMLSWDNNYVVFLQIEQGNLCFKIGEVYGDNAGKKQVRDQWHSIIMKNAKSKEFLEIKRPLKMHPGVYMTVAIVDRSKWLGENESIFNKDLVIARLNNYGAFLEEIVSNSKAA